MPRKSATVMSAMIRFWSKVDRRGEDECWLWLGQVGSRGYGNFSINSDRQVRAHRYAYESAFGEFGNSLMVLHKCDTPLCCNPRHLFLGTHEDNMKDMSEKGRTVHDRSYVTHCPQGHEYTEANTYLNNKSARTCLTCHRERSKISQRLLRLKNKIIRRIECQPSIS